MAVEADVPGEAPGVAEARHLIGQGRFAEAQRLLERHLKTQRKDKTAWWHLVDCRAQQGEWRRARHAICRLLALYPDDPEGFNRLGQVEIRLGDGAAGAKAFATALAGDPDKVGFLFSYGRTLAGLKRWEEALPVLQRAHALRPDFRTIFSLAAVLVELFRYETARPLLKEAHRLVPDIPEAWFQLGQLLLRVGDNDAAESCYHRVLTGGAQQDRVVASLGQCLQANLIDTVRAHLPAALTRFPEDPYLQFHAARLDRHDGQLAAARKRLRSIELPIEDHRRLFLLGEVEDRSNNPDGAMAAFTRANQLQGEESNGARLAVGYQELLGHLQQAFSPARVAQWSSVAAPDGDADPVFLVGFPRSGTTLLDTILMSHPAVTVLEEAPTLKGIDHFLGIDTDKPKMDRLTDLSKQEWTALRQDYRKRVAAWHDGSRPMVIDKFPLNLPKAGVLHRFFPKARFILLLRHPCDVVLSNFMQSFVLNPPMANMLTLEDAAGLYDRVMTLWCRHEDLFSLNSCVIRYEDLINDVRREMTGLLEFLGLEYDPAVEDHTGAARERGFISTPSYHQVTQPLYRRATGRWQRYAAAMASVRPVLDPWIRHWGYD